MAYSHDSFIVNSKTFSIVITIINSKIFSDGVYSFDSYGVSVGFGFDNSKAFDDDNSKAFDDDCFNSFEDGIAESRDYCESLCMGTSLYDSTPL